MFHFSTTALVRLSVPSVDMQSPSAFARAAKGVRGVQHAYRTMGRFDAVVFIHGKSDDDTRRAALELLRIPNVAHIEFLVGVPAPGSHR